MKAKKLYTTIILTVLLISPFVALYKLCPIVKAAVTERITNGSFEEFYINWTGTGTITDWGSHTGGFCLLLGSGQWIQSDNLGDVPVEDITSFGFYYEWCGTANFTIIFSDESNVSDTLSYVDTWTYVDLMPYLVSEKEVSFIYFVAISDTIWVDDVSLIVDGVEKVANGGFEETVIPGWTGTCMVRSDYAHSGTYSIGLAEGNWLLSDNVGNIPVKMVESFGFYYYAEDYYYCGAVKFTIIYSDGSNTSDTYSPWSSGWTYVDLTSYLPWDTPDVEISAIQFEYYPYPSGTFRIDDVSLMAYESWYEKSFTISRSDFIVEAYDEEGEYNFTFTVHLYIDSLNQTLETEMRIIQIHEDGESDGNQTVNVYLYINSSGVYIHAVGGTIGDPEEPMGSGYAQCSLKEWHTIYYEHLYLVETESESWSFQVDENELFSGTTSNWYYCYNGITLGAWGAPDEESNFSLYYDDVDWTAGYEDFEGEFPGEWTVEGEVGISTSYSVSPTNSLAVPLMGEPLSVSIEPETVTINRNTTQDFEAIASGGSPPYAYTWYVDGMEQEGEALSTFSFRTENLDVYEIWCNVTDYSETEVKSNVAVCTVEAGSLEITISPSIVSINLGEYENVTANVIGGTPPLQYQWYRNGTAIGTDSSRYEINATEWGVGVWTLHCNITDNESVENKSNVINVYISEGVLSVTISPSGTINSYKGLKTDFASTVSGGISPYRYEWYVNDILKATTSTYTLIHTDATTYNVILKVYDSGINSQWSNTATVNAANPTASLTPTLKSLRIGQSTVFTCTATVGMGKYAFAWYKNSELVYESPYTSNHINQYTYTPDSSEETGTYNFEVYVTFNTSYVEPFSVWSNENTVYLFGGVKRQPALVSRLTTSGVELPLGSSAQKSAFTAHDCYWQFYYDGYLSGGKEFGYLCYKYSMDTQIWVEPSGSPFSQILNNIAFWAPDLVPAVYHGWGGGVPFTLYYDQDSDILHLVYSSGSGTGSRSLNMVKATFNEAAIDWDWGTPETIVTYDSPHLPVCPSMTLASNGNPFVAFILSRGWSSPLVVYHDIYAYYNGTEWRLDPTGDPSSWSDTAIPKKLASFGSKIYITSFGAVSFGSSIAVFDTVTQTFTTEGTGAMVPQDSELWDYADYTDNVYIVVKAALNGSWIEGTSSADLRLDVYNGSYWFTDAVAWTFYDGPGTYTFSEYLSSYLQTDYEIANSRIRFWVTCYLGPFTITVDLAYYVLENSFGYGIETVPLIDYTESYDIGRTWQTLHINGYTSAENNWTKVGVSPYLNGGDDGSYITTTTSGATDFGYTFENLDVAGGVVHGAYLYLYYTGSNSHFDVNIYDGTSWQYAYHYDFYTTGYVGLYINVVGILDTFDKVNSAQLKFVHGNGENITIDYAELIIDYDYVEFPNNWVKNGSPPYLNASDDSNNISVTQSYVNIYLSDEERYVDMPVSNMISYFSMAQPTYSVNASYPTYIYYYSVRDVAFQGSPNNYISAFLLVETWQTPIRDDAGLVNMVFRHDHFSEWVDAGEWRNYTLYYMNLTLDITNIFDCKAIGLRAGQSSRYRFWNETLGNYQSEWITQTDGLYSGTTLASSLTLGGVPLCFHYYNEGMYVTRFNGIGWNVLKFLDENSTILRMNYGEDRCFSYVIETSSYDVKFFMPFVKVTVKAQTMDGKELSPVGFVMNSELLYTPYNNSYDIIGSYAVTLYPEHVYFKEDNVIYAFLYFIVEASPKIQYNTAYFQMDVTGDMIITIVYGTGGAPKTPEITPTPEPEKIKYCFPLSFYLVMVLIFLLGLYLYSRQETWKIAFPLIPVILWLLLTSPCPPWDLYLAIILTIIACAALLSKKRK